MQIRLARNSDMLDVARLFHAAFPESLEHLFGRGRNPDPSFTAQAFALCLSSEPAGFWVAEADGHLRGYLFAPKHLSHLWKVAITHGYLWRWAADVLTGRLRLGLQPLRLMLANKGAFIRNSVRPRHSADARILSIAVDPATRGQGIAGALCEQGLARFDRAGIPLVRLEVRPGNTPAVKLYRRLGFVPVDTMLDSQGEWVVMLRRHPNRGQAKERSPDRGSPTTPGL